MTRNYNYPQWIKDKYSCFKSKNGEDFIVTEASLSEPIKRVVELGIRNVNPEKVYLFGSKARGDSTDSSDYDIAFIFDIKHKNSWVDFVTTVYDAPLTIINVDLVDFNLASTELKKSIEQEKIVLYERK